MYIHIGNDVIIKKEYIVGIFDLDTATVSKHTRKFLADAEKRGEVITVSGDLPKSFIVYKEDKQKIFISPISSATLIKRNESPTLTISNET